MREALADIAHSAQVAAQLRPGDIVLDIGANDGTLLREYIGDEISLVGFEPAKNLLNEACRGTDLIIPNFFSASSFKRNLGPSAKARIITSIAMFYDLDHPHDFVRDIAGILARDGLWIVQMTYLPTMLSSNIFDTICHEHVGYYSFEAIKLLITAHGLEIRDVELNAVNGGSVRLYIQHQSHSDPRWQLIGAPERIKRIVHDERVIGLTNTATYQQFAERISSIKETIRRFVMDELANGKTFHVYGASTKGNTILQYFGLDRRHFEAAADRNKDKWGMHTIATNIPIVSEEESRAARPDYFFVLPWHFRDAFVAREQEFLAAGGSMVLPLPIPSLVCMRDKVLQEIPLGEASRRRSE